MKLLFSILLSLFIIGCVTSNSSYQPTTTKRIYDDKGTLIGKEREGKYCTRIYDAKGRLIGKAYKGKYCTRVYDDKGKLLYKIR